MADRQDPVARVALLTLGTEQYGIGQVAYVLASELKRRGHEPWIVALEEGPLTERCRAAGISCRVVELPPWPAYVRNKFQTILAVVRQQIWLRQAAQVLASGLRELSAEHLVVQWPTHVSLAGKSAQLVRVPCYWMLANVIRNSWPCGLNRRFYRMLVRRYQIKPLPNSHYTGDSLGGGLGAEVLYLGVDETRFAADRVRAFTRSELGLPPEASVAGIFARIDSTKGQEPAWRAMLELVRAGQDLHLLLVGGPTDGPTAQRLRELAAEHQAADRLHFADWSDTPERYYGAIDFAINATTIPEGFGLSVVEAMLMGRPVLVHALGGPAEIVLDGETGWHVPAGTVEALAAGLRRALADRAKWREMGEAARTRATNNFTSTAFAAKFVQIIGQGNRSPR